MPQSDVLTLGLGLTIFSFLITSVLIVPFINLLYRLKFTRREEGKKGKKSLFDKMHDVKKGTPVGAGILLVAVVSVIFAFIFPLGSHMGVFIRSAYDFKTELFLILFVFLGFGLLGLSDDYVRMFRKGRQGKLGMWLGIDRRIKFGIQFLIGLIAGYIMYSKLGISILHIPLINITLNLGWLYVPFASLVIVSFSNAFNITDGLDGLSCGLLAICLTAFGIISASVLDTPLSVFITIWLGSLLAFLYFNVYPARVWLGDTGAFAFGSTLGLIGLLTGSIIALVVIGGLFVLEVTSSAIQLFGWRVLKRPILPMAPLHLTFQVKGWEEPKIVQRAWLAGIMLAIFGLWLATI